LWIFLLISLTIFFQNIGIDQHVFVESKDLMMNFLNNLTAKVCFVSVVTLSCGALLAQPAPQGQGGSGPGKPPAEAMQACKSLSSGQDCSFTTSKGSRTGTCWAPEGKPLACKPKMPSASGGKNLK
jgi:hypothetical protein